MYKQPNVINRKYKFAKPNRKEVGKRHQSKLPERVESVDEYVKRMEEVEQAFDDKRETSQK